MLLDRFLGRIPAHGLDVSELIGGWRRRRRSGRRLDALERGGIGKLQRGGKALGKQRTVRGEVRGNGETAQGAVDRHRDVTRRRKVGVLLNGGELGAGLNSLGGGLEQREDARRLVRVRAEGNLAGGQRDAGAGQSGRARRRASIGPQVLTLELRMRHRRRCRAGGSSGKVAKDCTVVDGRTRDVELGQEVEQRGGLVDLALEDVEQLGIGLAHGKRGVHHAHERDRVRRDFHELGVAVGERLLRGVLEVDGLARHVEPVLVRVDRGARLIAHRLIHGAVERRVDGASLDASDLCGELAEERLDGGGVAGALDLEGTGELAFAFETLDEVEDLLTRATDSIHAGAGVDGGLDVVAEGEDFLGGQFDDGHGALSFLSERGLALAHEAGAVARDEHGVLGGDTAGGVGRGDFTHGHAHDGGRAGAEVREKIRERDLDGGDGDLARFRVVGLRVVADDVEDGPAGLKVYDLVELGEALSEERRDLQEVLDHLAVLGAEAGVDEDGTGRRWRVGRRNAHGDLALGNLAQAAHRIFLVRGGNDGAGARVVAAGENAGDVEEIRVGLLDEVCELARECLAARRQEAGDGQGEGRHDGRVVLVDGGLLLKAHLGRAAGGLTVEIRTVVREDEVGIGATEAEAGDARDLAAGVLGPLAGVGDNLEVLGVEVDVVVGLGEVDLARQLVGAHGGEHLDKTHDAGGGLGVADIRLRGAEQHGACGVAAVADDAAERGGLDGVTEDGAGAVGLDVVDGARVDAGVGVGATQDVDLGLGVRSGDAVGVAIRVHGGAANDAKDGVACGLGVGETLEHDEAGGIRAHDAIRVIRECVDIARGRDDAELAEAQRRVRSRKDIDAAGEGGIGSTRAQVAHSLVDGHQRGRARRVHVDGRAAQVQRVGHTVRDDGRGRTGERIGVHLRRVGGEQHAVVVVGGADVDAGGGAAQLVGGNAGILEGFPGQLEDDALLRVHVGGLERAQTKELRVEAGDVLDIATRGVLGFQLRGDHRVCRVFAPAAHGKRARASAVLGKHLPELRNVVGARETAGHADNRDVLLISLAGECGVTTSGRLRPLRLRLPGSINEAVRELRDGGVFVGHGRVEVRAQQVFQLAGEHDRVAGGQPEVFEGLGVRHFLRLDAGGLNHPIAQPDA